jgi:hypothetical protein
MYACMHVVLYVCMYACGLYMYSLSHTHHIPPPRTHTTVGVGTGLEENGVARKESDARGARGQGNVSVSVSCSVVVS